VLAVYVAALIVALVVIVAQAMGAHDADASGDAAVDHDTPAWLLIASLRFWAFALLAFGLSGALLTSFGLAGAAATAVIAGAAGLTSGAVATAVVRRMAARGPTSHVVRGDVVGRMGRVLVPSEAGVRGKIRVELKGTMVDYVALSEDALAENDAVIVVEYEGDHVVVSRAPRELGT
jgi:membrane protein implicated in regulation of membrane protease activity